MFTKKYVHVFVWKAQHDERWSQEHALTFCKLAWSFSNTNDAQLFQLFCLFVFLGGGLLLLFIYLFIASYPHFQLKFCSVQQKDIALVCALSFGNSELHSLMSVPYSLAQKTHHGNNNQLIKRNWERQFRCLWAHSQPIIIKCLTDINYDPVNSVIPSHKCARISLPIQLIAFHVIT